MAGDTVYVGSCSGVFYALDARTGTVHWRFNAGADGATQFHGNPLILRDLIIVGTDRSARGQTGYLYGLDRATGAPIWKRLANPGVPSDICGDDSSAFALTLGDSLLCLHPWTGNVQWSFRSSWRYDSAGLPDQIRALAGLVSSPVVRGEMVYFAGRDSVVYALHGRTGQSVWTRSIGRVISTQLAFAERTLIFGTDDSRIVNLDPLTGGVIADWPVDIAAMEALAYAADRVLCLGGARDKPPREILALDAQTGELCWRQRIPEPDSAAFWYVPRLHVWGDHVIAGSTNGLVVAYTINDGVPVWQRRLVGRIRGIGNGGRLLFVGTYEGVLSALKITVVGQPEHQAQE